MKVKTYYWHDRVYSSLRYKIETKLLGRTNCFKIGNAGDIFVKDLIEYKYNLAARNTENEGRLLLVGSISHKVQNRDIVCGIGTKVTEIPPAISRNVKIVGLRGPISYDVMKNNGFDVTDVKFLLDPGL